MPTLVVAEHWMLTAAVFLLVTVPASAGGGLDRHGRSDGALDRGGGAHFTSLSSTRCICPPRSPISVYKQTEVAHRFDRPSRIGLGFQLPDWGRCKSLEHVTHVLLCQFSRVERYTRASPTLVFIVCIVGLGSIRGAIIL